eukprot:m51a1_g8166 hypothetical protein (124) ;mRNA; f:86812-94661
MAARGRLVRVSLADSERDAQTRERALSELAEDVRGLREIREQMADVVAAQGQSLESEALQVEASAARAEEAVRKARDAHVLHASAEAKKLFQVSDLDDRNLDLYNPGARAGAHLHLHLVIHEM